jgi:hypothetical protein
MRRFAAQSVALLTLGLLCATCTKSAPNGGIISGGSTSGGSTSSGSASGGSASPDKAECWDRVYAYTVRQSFVGASGGIVLDDGHAFGFDALLGVKERLLSPEQLRSLSAAIDDANFFDLPPKLHEDIPDGNETELTVAECTRSYSSVNYMADSSDYKAALKAISSAAPAPRSGQAFSAPELLEPKLRAYLANKSPSELTRAAERWLGTAKQLLDQHAAMRHPPVASPSSATGVVP